MIENDKFTTKLKKQIINKLLSNETIVEYIDKNYLESPEELMYKNIFPYIKLDNGDLEEDEEIYIGVALSIPSIEENDIYKNVDITFFILSHINKMRTDNDGAVTDLIGDEVLSIFNHNEEFTFEFKLFSNDEGAYNEKYYYRQIVFNCIASNNMSNGVKINRYGR